MQLPDDGRLKLFKNHSMKKIMCNWKLVFAVLILFGSSCLSGCSKDYGSSGTVTTTRGPLTLSGSGSTSQMVPAVSGAGTSTFNGTFDPATGIMTYTVGWANLSGTPISGSFYAGATGSNGTTIGSPWTFPNTTGPGSISATMTLPSQYYTQLTGGNLYYTISTAANPSGEVRGQIKVP